MAVIVRDRGLSPRRLVLAEVAGAIGTTMAVYLAQSLSAPAAVDRS